MTSTDEHLTLAALTGPVAIVELGGRALLVHPLDGFSEHALVVSHYRIDACLRAVRQCLPDATPDELSRLTGDSMALVLDLAHEGVEAVLRWIADDPRAKQDDGPKGEGLQPRDVIGYIVARVAARTGRSVQNIASEPYALTLWTHAHLGEMEKFDGVRGMGDRLDLAHLVALSFHEPKRLTQAAHRYEELAGLLPSVEDTMTKALAMLPPEERARIEAQRQRNAFEEAS